MIASHMQWAECLVRSHSKRLVHAAQQELGGDYEGAEDVACEVIMAIAENRFAHVRLPAPEGLLVKYALSVCRNAARNRRRSNQRRAMLLVRLSTYDAACVDALTPTEALQAAPIREALGDLTPRERELVIRHWIHEATVPTIAAELNVSVNTVKELLRRARRKLQLSLQEIEATWRA
jgi:RNA polymerase sigma factor (sigma-70 family)